MRSTAVRGEIEAAPGAVVDYTSTTFWRIHEQPGAGVEARQGLSSLQAFEAIVANESTHDGAVFLLDPPDRSCGRAASV
jgi:hypothetical protein